MSYDPARHERWSQAQQQWNLLVRQLESLGNEQMLIYNQEAAGGADPDFTDWDSGNGIVSKQELINSAAFTADYLSWLGGTADPPQQDRRGFYQPFLNTQ